MTVRALARLAQSMLRRRALLARGSTLALALTLAALASFAVPTAFAADVKVLSAGAVEPGLLPVIAAFEAAGGDHVTVAFAPAPQLGPRIASGEPFDIVIAPPAVLDTLDASSRLASPRAERVTLGRVGIGVAVRPGAPRPDVSSADALRQALLDADSVVFNRASTGLYFESVLRRLGVEPQVTAKTTRYPDGAMVMAHVLKGHGREIGFGATTEILLVQGQGLQFVGPLPPDLQNFTTYTAAQVAGAPNAAAARALLAHLASAASKARFVAAGVDPPIGPPTAPPTASPIPPGTAPTSP